MDHKHQTQYAGVGEERHNASSFDALHQLVGIAKIKLWTKIIQKRQKM
jgi:hypothetical protein